MLSRWNGWVVKTAWLDGLVDIISGGTEVGGGLATADRLTGDIVIVVDRDRALSLPSEF